MDRHPSFLSRKFNNLSSSPEVEAVSKRTAKKTSEKLSTDKDARVQNYLDYLKDSLGLVDENRDTKEQPNRFEADERVKAEKMTRFKSTLYEKYILKQANIPESYWIGQSNIMKSEGRGGDFAKDDKGNIIISD